MEWISTNDRNPQELLSVLVDYGPFGDKTVAFKDGTVYISDGKVIQATQVNFWMIIPAIKK